MSPENLPYARVLVIGTRAADAERLLALAAALPPGVPVFADELGSAAGAMLGWQGLDERGRPGAAKTNAPGATPPDEHARACAALRALAASEGSADTLLISAHAVLPPFAFERLARAAELADFALVSALSNVVAELSPLAEGASAPLDDALGWDCGVFLAASHGLIECDTWSPSFALWRKPALDWLLAQPEDAGSELPAELRAAVCDDLFAADSRLGLEGPAPSADPRQAEPASPLALLRARLAPVPEALRCYPGLESRPVVLHVLHGWGGGVERFVRDLATADGARIHLALSAHGETARRRYGESLTLALAADPSRVLRRWPLPRAIAATAAGNLGYRALLDEVLAEFAVDAVVVSSVIGHDLAVLASGRPTLVVCHDYYPLWPILHCDFGDGARRFDLPELAHELAAGAEMPFAERDAAAWWTLRQRYLDALAAADATLVAPSESVRANLKRMAPELGALRIECIAHGLAPFPAHVALPEPPPRRRLRVLVLGRITGGKGERLLRAVIPAGAARSEFFLLGCGKSGERFFGQGQAHIELDYERGRLPELLGRIAPDLALIAADVAETYSYTLSELRALGVPVLATGIGSLGERIRHGEDGLLIAPRAEAIVAALRALSEDRTPLESIRARLAGWRERGLEEMAQDYAALLPAQRAAARAATRPEVGLALELADTTLARTRAERERAELSARVAAQQAELERRGDWGHELGRQLAERTRWAKSLERELAEPRKEFEILAAAHGKLTEEFNERTEWALALEKRCAELEAERMVVLQSASWRITRPLRYAMRKVRSFRTESVYRLGRIRALFTRARLSLAQRGPLGTLKRGLELMRRGRQPLAPANMPALDAPFEPFALPASSAPRVSLVIPVFNQFRHTLVCLKALAANACSVPFETIVVDDCSSDETAAHLPQIGGIRVIRNAENLGFIGASNAGAAAAAGEFLVFLNNDTAPQPGWIEALVATFERHGDCGLAGAKLVYPDGRLQEAGSIVFSDGSGWNYGRFGDPADPQFNYLREADYCSGAALMIRRALFAELGGFDLRYRPAYYEDTDLAFQVRARGLRVLYQPEAVVVHFEGATSGTDTGSGAKRFQVVNQEKFVERWREALARQPKPGTPIVLAREHRARGRILIIDATVPQPDHDSGSLRLVNVMQVLAGMGWKVAFFAENCAYLEGYSEALQRLGVETAHHPWIPDPLSWLRSHGREFDAVWVSRHYVLAPLLPVLREYAPRAKLIFDTVDLHYLREQRGAELAGDAELRRLAVETKARELRLVRAADVTLVVSAVEQALLQREAPGARVEVLSNVHAPPLTCTGFAPRRDICFVGGFQHPPNVDAVRWFVQEIWPIIAVALPEVRFHVIGSRVPEEIAALAGERVLVHGYVPDLSPYLDGCRISVAPLRYGAGVKGKVNQAMAHGQPVVATPIAVEGMQLEAGREALVASDPNAFAGAVVKLYQSPGLWQQLSEAGRANVARHFSFAAAAAALKRVLPT